MDSNRSLHEIDSLVNQEPASTGDRSADTSTGASILVVEDDESILTLLARLLERDGHQVTEAADGRVGLEKLRQNLFDLVLLDINLPGLNGYEILDAMKADERLCHVPVIVISARDDVESLVRCIKMGADDYLTKPFNPVLLQARIDASLEKKRLRDQEQDYTRRLQEMNSQLEHRVEDSTRELREKNQILERRVREVSAMINVSTSIISVLNVDSLLQQIMELSKEVMNAEASSLLILDPKSGKLRFHVARGTVGKSLKSATVELGHGIAGWVAQTGEPLLIPDAYQDPRFDPAYDQKTGFRTRSILTVPVKAKGEIIGVVEVINKRGHAAFDDHDLHLFQSFASLASVSLENARLFQQTERDALALRDALEKERRLSIEKEKMGAFIPKNVLDEISRSRERKLALGGKIVEATVLFSDIQGFTRLSETMRPQDVVTFLNEYMTAMAGAVDEEGGIIDKFLGDGIMAIFSPGGAEQPHHAMRAIRSGIRMQQEIRRLRRRWRQARPEVADLKVRIGINTGEVVAGNVGAETRMEYTVIGDNVNVASRIESNSRPGEVTISESTYRYVEGAVPAVKMDPITVKNRAQPVQTYAVKAGRTLPGGRFECERTDGILHPAAQPAMVVPEPVRRRPVATVTPAPVH